MPETTNHPETEDDLETWSDKGDRQAGNIADVRLYDVNTLEIHERIKTSEATRTESRKSQEHTRKMQGYVLIGVGSLIMLTLASVLFCLWTEVIDADFAREIMQTMLAPIIGAGLTIVGFFFRSGGTSS